MLTLTDIVLVVAIAWIGVLTVVVGACRSAARGDRALLVARDPGQPGRPERARLRLVA